jgi:anaphase-promoting complex subunit 10
LGTKDAVCWSLSSAKPGNGVDQIRDSSVETYWQSDGSQPHAIQITFGRRVAVSHVCLYLDFNLDESYTPKRICVEAGMTLQELQTLSIVELSEPVGWCIIPIEAPPDPLDSMAEQDNENYQPTSMPIRTHLIQISVLSMHQNGRDTHVRQVKLFGPRRGEQANRNIHRDDDHNVSSALATMHQMAFSTVELSQFSTIR